MLFVKEIIKKIKTKRSEVTCFMESGEMGAIIGCVLLCTLFGTVVLCSVLGNNMLIPAIIMALLLSILIPEIVYLVVRLLVAGRKRSRVYFVVTWLFVMMINLVATAAQAMLAVVVMSLCLVLATEAIFGCTWAFVKTGKWKQVFGYIIFVFSFLYIVLFIIIFVNDNWGESRIEYYYKDLTKADDSVSGFAEYLQDGSFETGLLTYGPNDSDIQTATVDLTLYEKRESVYKKITDMLSSYEIDKAPVAGAIWYPLNASKCPVFFMVHGAHDAHAPSYLGYEYLGKYLASNGYVVVSVDENIINDLDSGNNVRAILLLENIKAILAENENENSPIFNLIDSDRLAIGGHSRGGEMVATAYLFNSLDVYPDNGNVLLDYDFNISSIVAIAPTVDQYMPASHAVEISDVDYLLLHGANDQDVSKMMGEKQYNNVLFSNDKERKCCKASVYIVGANHGQFNSEWGRYDLIPGLNGYLNTNNFLSSDEQQLIAKAYIRTFLDKSLMGMSAYDGLLVDNTGFLKYLPRTEYITNYMDSEYTKLCDFDKSVDLYRGHNNSARVWCRGMSIWHTRKSDLGSGTDSDNYMLECSWKKENNPRVEIDLPETNMKNNVVSFRISDARENIADISDGLKYSIELTDEWGNISLANVPVYIYPGLAIQLYKQDVLFDTYEYKYQMQTVRVDMNQFCGDVDFEHINKLSISLDGTADGKVWIDDICIGPR